MIGICTFVVQDALNSGPGISGIIPISAAAREIELARSADFESPPFSRRPYLPTHTFPVEAYDWISAEEADLQSYRIKV